MAPRGVAPALDLDLTSARLPGLVSCVPLAPDRRTSQLALLVALLRLLQPEDAVAEG